MCAGVWNVEVRPAISTDPNPNPNSNRIHNRKLSLLEMAENNYYINNLLIRLRIRRISRNANPNPKPVVKVGRH